MKTIIAGLHLLTVLYFFVVAAIKYTEALPGAGFYLAIAIGFAALYLIFRKDYKR